MPTINGDNTTAQEISGSGQIWTLTKDATILLASGFALNEASGLHDNTIIINGIVRVEPDGGNTAFYSAGARTTVRIGEDAFLSGYNGVMCNGADFQIFNNGTISASTTGGDGVGIYALSAGGEVVNDGLVSANHAIIFGGGEMSFTNKADGFVIGYVHPIWATGSATTITNHGIITKVGGGAAITGETGEERIKNDGLIDGDVRLGGGNDYFDNRRGEVRGFVYGGDGDDTLITAKPLVALFEMFNEGHDTVKSSASYELATNVEALVLTGAKSLKGTGNAGANELTGNGGKNVLLGLAGEDTLSGGKGTDRLTGGTEADTFVFHRNDGVDTITDYVDEADRIAILGFGNIDSFQKLSHRIDQHGDDVWITLGGGDKLILNDADKRTLEETDFDFAS